MYNGQDCVLFPPGRVAAGSQEEAAMIGEADEAALDDVVEQQSARRMPVNERLQVQQIEALETEQLEEEEVDSDAESHGNGPRMDGRGSRAVRTFDTSLASRHCYLGDVDDTGHGRAFLEEGAVIKLPMLYLEGTVLFPDATLPLRVVQRRCKAAVEHAIHQNDAPYTLGVLHVRARSAGTAVHVALVGTTAEIRQLRHLADGSINVVARGRQRFRVQDAWTEADGTPCAQVKIVQESRPTQIPRDAFSSTAAVPSCESGRVPRASHDTNEFSDDDFPVQPNSEADDDDIGGRVARFLGGHGTLTNLLLQFEEQSSDDETNEIMALPRWLQRRPLFHADDAQRVERPQLAATVPDRLAHAAVTGETSEEGGHNKRVRVDGDWGGACKAWGRDESKWIFRAQRAAWPHWVYRMYDAFDLARRAADMWRQMVELPSMDDLIRDPGMLSFFIASKMPLPDATRQELLELDSVVYRLRREIQLLECMDQIRCKTCKATIARRSDMLAMSTDGPVNAYVNEHGYVHETLTLRKAHGLNLPGRPETEHSWFPGYAWTIAYCVCDTHMGWRFTAMKKDMNPRGFWGIRRSQIAAVQ